MKEENITRVSWEQWKQMKDKTDWERFQNMTEEEIEKNALDILTAILTLNKN